MGPLTRDLAWRSTDGGLAALGSEKLELGGWQGPWSPSTPPPPAGAGSNGQLSFFHVYHAYSMTKPGMPLYGP